MTNKQAYHIDHTYTKARGVLPPLMNPGAVSAAVNVGTVRGKLCAHRKRQHDGCPRFTKRPLQHLGRAQIVGKAFIIYHYHV